MAEEQVRYERGKWLLQVPPDIAIRANAAITRLVRDFRRGGFWLSDTPENCADLRWFMRRFPLTISPRNARRLRKQEKRYKDVRAWVAAPVYEDREDMCLAIPARQYQKEAAQRALRLGALLLADDLGLGKTASALAALAPAEQRPALIVTLTALPRQWQAEAARFLPNCSSHILKKTTPYDLKKDGSLPDLIICNYHKLAGWAPELMGKVRSIVFDEVQELRSGTQTLKGSAAKMLADRCSLKIGLSATPVYNYGTEIHNIFETLQPELLGTKPEFRREWTRSDGDAVADPPALGAFLERSGYFLRRTRADVGRELPPLTRVPHHVNLQQEPLKAVEGRAKELAELILRESANIVERRESFSAGAQLDALMRQATGISKAPHVADFVEMLLATEEKVVLFGWHRAVYDIWLQRLEAFRPQLFTGTESANQKHRAQEAFVQGDCRLLIMSLRAGLGLDGLQKNCRTLVFGELDWSPGVHAQCEGRIDRDGQRDPVTAYYLCAEDGVDPIMMDVLGVKKLQAEGIRNPSDKQDTSQLDGMGARIRQLAEAIKQRG